MSEFASVRIAGGLLSSTLLERVFAGDPQVPGTSPQTYGLERNESVRQQASRSWLYLIDVWQEFQRRIAEADIAGGPAPAEARSARVTRERWLRILLREFGFHDLSADGTVEVESKTFPVSHRSAHVPVHLLGWQTDLDHKTPNVTARAPQSMLQELLNRDDSRLWAVLSNGITLRLLRDSAALVGSSYVEFDLQAIFDGELFSDFVLLYLVCHQTRFASQEDARPETCYLEQWRGFDAEQGERALEQLRNGVEEAIAILGTGFISCPANPQLRSRLDPVVGDLQLADLNRALLRLVYRLLFWFVAEDRNALLTPDLPEGDPGTAARLREARERYETYFSSGRLRQLARRNRGGRHNDLWEAVQLVFDALGTEGGLPELALPGIGGIFETGQADGRALPLDEPLTGARLPNQALLGAVRALSMVKSRTGGGLRRVDFGNLGAEELGSVYESLLERIPHYDPEQLSYTLDVLAGNERKESGSYYTPTSLVECLLDSALDPLLDEACKRPTPEDRVAALLDITICDPACGSGHFLVAAARRIAKRVAAEETREPEPPETVIRAALRRVTGRCIYGVDVNPMAAELARVALCMEALEPGRPLAFLDQNIRVGNSLLGTTPALLAGGIPDNAFKPIEGDDKNVAAALRKQNAKEKAGQHDLFSPAGIPVSNAELARRASQITRGLPDSLEDLHAHQQRQALDLETSAELRQQKVLADAWCAAFVQPKTDETRRTAITQATLEAFADDHGTLASAAAEEFVAGLARQYRFFHWHIEFPHVFRTGDSVDIDPATGWAGGFSCVIGNPPWERVKLQEQEFFAARRPEIANAPNAAARKSLIAALKASGDSNDQFLYGQFISELRKASGESLMLRDSGRYPLTGQGDINTYATFAETARSIMGQLATVGIIVPTKIATDNTTRYFFGELVQSQSIASLFDFSYTSNFFKSIAIAQGNRFCLLTMTSWSSSHMRLAFLCDSVADAVDPARQAALSVEDIVLVNPNTKTCPTFRTNLDAKITIGIYERVPVLWRDDPEDNPWGLSFMRMFDMASDSGLFRTREELQGSDWLLDGNVFAKDNKRMLPLYEAKMIHYYDHRFGDYRNVKIVPGKQVRQLPTPDAMAHDDPAFQVLPRYWIQEFDTPNEQRSKPRKPAFHLGVGSRLSGRRWEKGWLCGWRDVASAVDERTVISGALPVAAVGHKFLLYFTDTSPELLTANLSSFVLDYTARQKFAGTSMAYFVLKQLPVLPPRAYDQPLSWLPGRLTAWIRERVLELSYTSWDMQPFACDLGDEQPPFRWDEGRRDLIRAELDAIYFHLYGLDYDAVEHVMESFKVLRASQERELGEFRSKRLILERYDAMAEAARSGRSYQTVLDPPPGYGARHDPSGRVARRPGA